MKKQLGIAVAIAFALWFVMFSPWTKDMVDFWNVMCSSAILLTGLSFVFGKKIWNERVRRWHLQSIDYWLKQIALGLTLAIVLWGIFWVGDKVSQWLFDFANEQINGIYNIRGTWNPKVLSILLICLIGPAEELFWRGYVQEQMSRWLGRLVGTIATIGVYTAIHIASGNFMLIMAALVCGIIWGGLYWWKPQWLPALVISHALWDAVVFIWIPI